MARLVLLALVVSVAACSDDAPPSADARPDAQAVDAMVDAQQGCIGSQEFTGELIDFDSSPVNFMGIPDARFTLRGEPGCTALTAPNGRFILAMPAATSVVFDVDAPGDYLDGIWPVDSGLAATAVFSARGFDADDLGVLGVTLDPTKAQVLLYQNGTPPVALTLSGNPEATFTTADGAVWTAGNDEAYILFANVEVGSGLVTLTDPTGVTVPVGELRVEAGKVTYITTRQLPE